MYSKCTHKNLIIASLLVFAYFYTVIRNQIMYKIFNDIDKTFVINLTKDIQKRTCYKEFNEKCDVMNL